jgi:phage-related protein
VSAHAVSYYRASSDESPVRKFLNKLDVKAQTKCYSYVSLLEERGFALPRSHLAKVEDGIWELRPEWQGVEYRLLFTSYKNQFIIVHALKKKSDRLRSRDLDIARRRAREVAEFYAALTNR